jgi:dihydrolipoamide dehydrogenase
MGETEGFVKIISDHRYEGILGAVIVGANATELIGEILAMKHSEGTMNELASMVHAHPAISEAIGENANALLKQAIHM